MPGMLNTYLFDGGFPETDTLQTSSLRLVI